MKLQTHKNANLWPTFLKVATPDSHPSSTFLQTTDAFLRFWPANCINKQRRQKRRRWRRNYCQLHQFPAQHSRRRRIPKLTCNKLCSLLKMGEYEVGNYVQAGKQEHTDLQKTQKSTASLSSWITGKQDSSIILIMKPWRVLSGVTGEHRCVWRTYWLKKALFLFLG